MEGPEYEPERLLFWTRLNRDKPAPYLYNAPTYVNGPLFADVQIKLTRSLHVFALIDEYPGGKLLLLRQ
jgi:hypothetical protein